MEPYNCKHVCVGWSIHRDPGPPARSFCVLCLPVAFIQGLGFRAFRV